MIRPVEMGAAIEKARTVDGRKITQEAIGEALGISQGEVSVLCRGQRMPSIEQMIGIEKTCGRPPGFLLRAAGYLHDLDVRSAIVADPDIPDGARVVILGAYDAAVPKKPTRRPHATDDRRQHRA